MNPPTATKNGLLSHNPIAEHGNQCPGDDQILLHLFV